LFGFYDTSSDQDQTFLNLQLPSWDRELKTRWLEKFGIDDTPFPYNDILKVTSQGFPNEVTAWFRAYFYKPTKKDKSNINYMPSPLKMIDQEIERDVFQALQDVVKDHLKEYTTTYQEDLDLLNHAENLDPRTKLAIQIRSTEKKTLENALTSLNQKKVFVGDKQPAVFSTKTTKKP